ncbi:cyclin-dependent protein kinase inhibitor SMR6 [Artemisia annua]|uniref:Cyclin-dependent protein kinase inhibitor SMR6 n=1 Tax=Artemisia annua TaxID=35608 RepID=A0A2U1M4N7_ARTAN|nr:cyclin-dependent protein kinase inhibitor SMR6 [Artemisia annua]
MKFFKKNQSNGDIDKEGNKWIGIKLKPISTKTKNKNEKEDEDEKLSKSGSTTPTANHSRIPKVLPCPPPPRKRRPVSTCHEGNMEFFTSPDIESLFKMFPNAGRAN